MNPSAATELNIQEPVISQEPAVSQVPAISQKPSRSLASGNKVVNKPIKEVKKPDLTKPIEVTDHMEVVVNGKKCLLKVNPDTGQLCAYPLLASGRG